MRQDLLLATRESTEAMHVAAMWRKAEGGMMRVRTALEIWFALFYYHRVLRDGYDLNNLRSMIQDGVLWILLIVILLVFEFIGGIVDAAEYDDELHGENASAE